MKIFYVMHLYVCVCVFVYVRMCYVRMYVCRVGQYTEILGVSQCHFDTDYSCINTEILYLNII